MRITCLNYVRSALAVNEECKFGPAEQVFIVDFYIYEIGDVIYVIYWE